MSDINPMTIKPITEAPTSATSVHDTWNPVIGTEITEFLRTRVPDESRDEILESTVSILSKCANPYSSPRQETGLVIGYVQSGKTMSFEAVAALSHDNSMQLIILITGISNPLFAQSTRRIRQDLRIDDPTRSRRWIMFENPSIDDDYNSFETIKNTLEDWRYPNIPDNLKKTVFIAVLKQHQRLQGLTSLLNSLDLSTVPVLIIDDEADQASLNIEVSNKSESTTYRRIMELRQALPHHTYLQYTATPQAPLLINIIDSMSPNFVQILNPGNAYIGGKDFFSDDNKFIRIIPPDDVPGREETFTAPPESLEQALRIFMVGVSAGIQLEGDKMSNRSMLVHPSHRTEYHQEFYLWVKDLFDEWKRTLTLPPDDLDKQQLIADFKDAYFDLTNTVGHSLVTFDDIQKFLPIAFRNTRVLEVNTRQSGTTPTVDWSSAYGWILVGGQAMDRGFTIEGLTVTYMPRGIGQGNADTIQQRARFFGYKRSYMGYCRIYLEQGTRQAFEMYVDHEEDIRQQLENIEYNNLSLDDWKRAFVLDSDLRPCRQSVLTFDYIRGQFADYWVVPRIVFSSMQTIQSNRDIVALALKNLNFVEDDGHSDRRPAQRHDVARDIPLQQVVESLLLKFRIVDANDSHRYTGMLLQLSHALANDPNETCTIFRMSPNHPRKRRVKNNGSISELFQGQFPVEPVEKRGEVYPGDRYIHDTDKVTLQIHQLVLNDEGETVAENVPVIAIWIPNRLGVGWVIQPQEILKST